MCSLVSVAQKSGFIRELESPAMMNEFTSISVEQNISQTFIVFEINNLSELLQKVSVGQFVKSCIELNFPTSIGKSKWDIILFLNGQYDHIGIHDERVSVYLKLTSCEHQSKVLKFDVKFQLGSKCGWEQEQCLCINNIRTRWIRTHLININDIISDGCLDDTLLLSLYLKENVSISSTAKTIYNYIVEAEPYDKSEFRMKSLNRSVISSRHSSDYSHSSIAQKVSMVNYKVSSKIRAYRI